MTVAQPDRTCSLDSDAFAAIVIAEAPPSDLTGMLLDHRYELLDRIGSGGMGVVYRARHVRLGRIVAIKIVKVPMRDVGTCQKRFENEAMAMARLDHPNCATIVDSGMLGRRAYVVMDFVSGVDLSSILERGPLPPARAIAIVRQVLAGLAHAHERGIVHRDIKPANILVTRQPGLGDHVKIVDFGLARFREGHADLTRGLVVGTPSYMAPEQIRGRAIDARTDVYSCGVLLFELLAGKPPYASINNDALEVLTRHITRPVPRLSEVTGRPELAIYDDAIARAMAKDPDARFASAAAFADVLAALDKPAPAPSLSAITKPQVLPTIAVSESTPTTAARGASSDSTARLLASARNRRGLAVTLVACALIITAGVGFARQALEPSKRPAPAPVATLPAEPAPVDVQGVIAPAPVVAVDPIDEAIARSLATARELLANKRHADAVELLEELRERHGARGEIELLIGRAYLENLWWADGIKQLRKAIALDPALRTHPELVQSVLRGFVTTSRYNVVVGAFLRDSIGAAAAPELERIANTHRNPKIRLRAAAEARRLSKSR